jgi:hypothetical protein
MNSQTNGKNLIITVSIGIMFGWEKINVSALKKKNALVLAGGKT